MVDRGIRIVVVEGTIIVMMVKTRVLMVHQVRQFHTAIIEADRDLRHRTSGEQQDQRYNENPHGHQPIIRKFTDQCR